MSTNIIFEHPTFAGLPLGNIADLISGRIAVFGAMEATPYDRAVASHSAQAPGAIREASKALAGQLKQHDFDLGATLIPNGATSEWLGIDLGDLND